MALAVFSLFGAYSVTGYTTVWSYGAGAGGSRRRSLEEWSPAPGLGPSAQYPHDPGDDVDPSRDDETNTE